LNVKKTLAIAGIATTIGVAGIGGLGVVSAATDTSASDDKTSLVAKLADKFHLNKSEVQAVFDQDHTEHEAKRQQQLEERLTKAVEDGKITAAQKDTILAKMKELQAEMQANHDAMQDKTDDERHASMEQQRQDLKKWAEDNNIPLQYLMMLKGGPHSGPGHMMHKAPGDANEQ
jgi:hypothetical protein